MTTTVPRTSGLTATDLFCGAGGSSIGIEAAGGTLRMAANHWKLAVDTHNTNFPHADHDIADISQVEPRRYPTTDVLWASPECTNHSQAKGKKRVTGQGDLFGEAPDPAAERSRATMWDVLRFAEIHRYKAMIVENVVDVVKWVYWPAWRLGLEALGYDVHVVSLNSAHTNGEGGVLPAPQSRDRVYIVCVPKGTVIDLELRPSVWCPRCEQIVEGRQAWKQGRWVGRYKQQYVYACSGCGAHAEPLVRPAAAAIDWTLIGDRIGDRAKPLRPATLRRIEAGIRKFGRPLTATVAGNTFERPGAEGLSERRNFSASQPIGTLCADPHFGIVEPPGGFVAELRGGGSGARSVEDPLATVTAGGQHHALVVPPGFVMRNNTARGNPGQMNTPFDEPLRTMTTAGHQSVVLLPPHLVVDYYRNGAVRSVNVPIGTVTTVDRHALLDPAEMIDDCLFRMLAPHEIGAAMAFPGSYQVLGSKRDKVRMYGNGVTPPSSTLVWLRVVEAIGATA